MKEIDEKDLVEITGGGIGDKLLDIELEKPSDGTDDGGSGGGPGLLDRAGDGGAGSGNTGADSTGTGGTGGNSGIN